MNSIGSAMAACPSQVSSLSRAHLACLPLQDLGLSSPSLLGNRLQSPTPQGQGSQGNSRVDRG